MSDVVWLAWTCYGDPETSPIMESVHADSDGAQDACDQRLGRVRHGAVTPWQFDDSKGSQRRYVDFAQHAGWQRVVVERVLPS